MKRCSLFADSFMSLLTLHTLADRTRMLLLPLFVPVLGLAGCSLSDLVGKSTIPPGTADPTVIETQEGALGTYYGAVRLLNQVGSEFSHMSGLFSDELRPSSISSRIGDATVDRVLDSRYLPGEGETSVPSQNLGDALFQNLHKLRGNVRQSRGALRAYAPNVSRAIVGHTYAIEGFAEVLLADLYCSGIPLSTVNFGGDYTLKSGSTTEEVYQHAIVLFDSALALSDDSLRLKEFARIGKARALVALGDYAGAQQASADVNTDFTYELKYRARVGIQGDVTLSNAFRWSIGPANRGFGDQGSGGATVSDREGVDTSRIRGIPYASRNDPRANIRRTQLSGVLAPYPVYVTTKYDSTGATPIVIASGIEARLIQAEAELAQGSSQWLVTLNALRTTCTTAAACPSPAPAGSGKFAGLPPLSDPGNPRDRLALLFEERAFWLFLTGHRQGDMRRLIREYGWQLDEVYPTGEYYGRNAAGVYGNFVNLPTPRDERINNRLYQGCSHRRA